MYADRQTQSKHLTRLTTHFGQFVQVHIDRHACHRACACAQLIRAAWKILNSLWVLSLGNLSSKKDKTEPSTHKKSYAHSAGRSSFHRSTSGLKYHIHAKHTLQGDFASISDDAPPSLRQTNLTKRRGLTKSTSEKTH